VLVAVGFAVALGVAVGFTLGETLGFTVGEALGFTVGDETGAVVLGGSGGFVLADGFILGDVFAVLLGFGDILGDVLGDGVTSGLAGGSECKSHVCSGSIYIASSALVQDLLVALSVLVINTNSLASGQ
jgi:hypothetical protein